MFFYFAYLINYSKNIINNIYNLMNFQADKKAENVEILKIHNRIVEFCANDLKAPDLAVSFASMNFKTHIPIIQQMISCYINSDGVMLNGNINPAILCLIELLKKVCLTASNRGYVKDTVENIQITEEIAQKIYDICFDLKNLKL